MRRSLSFLGPAALFIGVFLLFALRRETSVTFEPVSFASMQLELFGISGTLTDAWADFDGDGDPDRFVGFNGEASRLYLNDGVAGFSEVAADMGLIVERSVRTSAWGDFDADGDPDLLLGYAGEAPVTALYRNDGGEGFINVADEVGLQLSEGSTRQASWIDYDADGDLDLFLALRDRENRLYRNDVRADGARTFIDVTAATGIGDTRRTVGAVWLDYDQDGDLDVLVANMNGDANGLYRNNGGTFTDVAPGTLVAAGGRGLADESLGTVRPCAVDYDNDGRFDFFFANYGPNELLRSTGPDSWTAVGVQFGLAIDARFDSCIWGDFDHDGREDLFVNGTVTGGIQYRDYLMRREGTDSFVDVNPEEIFASSLDHGATWVDYDLDGDLDLAVTGAPDDGVHSLMQNLLRPEFAWHSLKVRVLDENGAATRPGSEVRVYAAGTERLLGTRLVDTGSGYDAQSDLPVHFGLPGAQPVDVVVTVIANGRHDGVVTNVDPADHRGSVLTVRISRDGRIVR